LRKEVVTFKNRKTEKQKNRKTEKQKNMTLKNFEAGSKLRKKKEEKRHNKKINRIA